MFSELVQCMEKRSTIYHCPASKQAMERILMMSDYSIMMSHTYIQLLVDYTLSSYGSHFLTLKATLADSTASQGLGRSRNTENRHDDLRMFVSFQGRKRDHTYTHTDLRQLLPPIQTHLYTHLGTQELPHPTDRDQKTPPYKQNTFTVNNISCLHLHDNRC